MRIEQHNLDGLGAKDHEVYDMPSKHPDYWAAVTTVECPVANCAHVVVWYEAGYVPGYRVCMAPGRGQDGAVEQAIFSGIRHRFQASGTAERPTLILIEEEESNG